MNSTENVTGTGTVDSGRRDSQFFIALGFMVVAATAANIIAGRRVIKLTREYCTFKKFPIDSEFLGMAEAAKFPITGSCVLFGLYLCFRYLPPYWVNLLLSGYLAAISVGALAAAVRPWLGANPLVGAACVAFGGAYFVTNNWVINNILAFGICVAGIESIPITTFKVSALLLCGLFVYDVFWVFGTDVMVTVAKNVQGPIKLLFPQTIFGDHTKKSLLGLGDIVIPGFFMMQMLRFSLYTSNGKSTKYFMVSIVAYVLALLNTMFVMVVFDAAQPALLYIVPWLLLSVLAVAFVSGELKALFLFDEENTHKLLVEEAKVKHTARFEKAEKAVKASKDMTLLRAVLEGVLYIFGLDRATLEEASIESNRKLQQQRR